LVFGASGGAYLCEVEKDIDAVTLSGEYEIQSRNDSSMSLPVALAGPGSGGGQGPGNPT
jgi:hypothetical protein